MSLQAATPGFRCFAALDSGVHAVPHSDAAAMLRRVRGADGVDAESEGADVPLLWIDVTNPGEEHAAYLRDELGFHPLAVEDCLRGRQRPKLDRYTGYFFLVVYAATVNPERRRMALNEVHLFLGPGYLVTVHDQRVAEVPEVFARWRASPKLFPDAGALAHALIDALVDSYFGVLGHIGEQAEKLENDMLADPRHASAEPVLRLRRELMLFRRIVAPERDVLSTLLRRDLPFLRHELLPYFQDVHDHTIRVTEEIDSLRELLGALLDAQRSEASNQLNQTVRVLTAWSIILMSMTLVAGIYGMNFAWMPELEWRYGYFGALALMLAVGVVLGLLFRRRQWL